MWSKSELDSDSAENPKNNATPNVFNEAITADKLQTLRTTDFCNEQNNFCAKLSDLWLIWDVEVVHPESNSPSFLCECTDPMNWSPIFATRIEKDMIFTAGN